MQLDAKAKGDPGLLVLSAGTCVHSARLTYYRDKSFFNYKEHYV